MLFGKDLPRAGRLEEADVVVSRKAVREPGADTRSARYNVEDRTFDRNTRAGGIKEQAQAR